MRIVFLGATELGYQCLQQLFKMREEVVGIFSIPEEFRISYSTIQVRNVTFRSFEDLAKEHKVPLVYVTSKMSNPEYIEALQTWQPDFGLAIGWYYMIPRSVRDKFPRSVIGIHASLLPKYRGGAPLVWAMIKGETKTGVTLFYLDDGVDTGNIIAQKEIDIGRDDTIKILYDKAVQASIDLVREFIPLIRSGIAPRIPQDHAVATQFPQRRPEDGLIDWSRGAEEIRNFIRAQTKPYPGAFTIIGGKKIIIWEADVIDLASCGSSKEGE